MERTKNLRMSKTNIKTQTLATILAVAGAVALPQLFHQLGAVSGLGSALGEAFLPMYLPILLVGLIAGPVAGMLSGIIAPLVSFGLTGMPGIVILPFIAVELAVYGLTSGLLRDKKLPTIGKVIAAQLAGRLVRAGAVLLSVFAFQNESVAVATIWTTLLTALPGFLLQWSFVPLIVFWVNNRKRHES